MENKPESQQSAPNAYIVEVTNAINAVLEDEIFIALHQGFLQVCYTNFSIENISSVGNYLVYETYNLFLEKYFYQHMLLYMPTFSLSRLEYEMNNSSQNIDIFHPNGPGVLQTFNNFEQFTGAMMLIHETEQANGNENHNHQSEVNNSYVQNILALIGQSDEPVNTNIQLFNDILIMRATHNGNHNNDLDENNNDDAEDLDDHVNDE